MSVPLKPLKWYKNLATRKGRLEAGAFLVEGDRAVEQVIHSHPHEILEIVTVADPLPVYRNYPVRQVTDSQFRSMSSARTPQGIIAVVRVPVDVYSDKLPETIGNKVLLLEDVQDPGNVGTLIRTAAAFDYSGVILTEKCADPLSPKCVQATAGAVLSVWLRRTALYLKIAETLQEKGYFLVAAELHGVEDVSVISRENKLLLALGNEAVGLSESVREMSDCRLRIPTVRGKAESLNVAVCGAICMYLSSRTSRD